MSRSILSQDSRYAIRLLKRTPGFTAVAIITLAVGIGANTAIFSLINAVLLRPLPARDAGQLVVLRWSAHKEPKIRWLSSYGDTAPSRDRSKPEGDSFSHPFFQQVENSKLFASVGAFAGAGPMALSGNGPATTVHGQVVSGDFFNTLGIHPALGRLLQPSDDRTSAPPAIVLNYCYWQKAFGASPSVLGRVVKLNGLPFTIVGVAERKFLSLSFDAIYDVWLPMSFKPAVNPGTFDRPYNDPTAWWLLMVARLKPSVPVSQTSAAVDLLFRNEVLHGAKPLLHENDAPKITLIPAQDALVGHSGYFKDPLHVLMVGVALVLLIACANVAGLVLGRATARRREIAVRLALGATRGRLMRQLLTESLLLALAGGALGILLAWWGAHAIAAQIASGQDRPAWFTSALDLRVLGFTLLVSLFTGIISGLAPAFRSLRLDLTPGLKQDSQSSWSAQQGGNRVLHMGNLLVALQAALAIVVLVGAGLFVHTLRNLKNLDPGFDTRNVLTFDLSPKLSGYKPDQIDELYRDLHEQFSALPGVLSVSYSQAALLEGSLMRGSFKYVPPGQSSPVEKNADWMPVSADFFTTMRIPLLAGRKFTPGEYEQAAKNSSLEMAMVPGVKAGPPDTRAPLAAVVNEAFVKQYYPGVNPLGQHFGEGRDVEGPGREPGYYIVGVAGDAKYNSLRRDIEPTLYVPLTHSQAVFEMRTANDPKSLIAPVRELINKRDSNLPMMDVKTESEHVDMLLGQERMVAQLSSYFGAVALLLACIGLYGLLSYEVTRRTREIGIRMALGARRGNLIRLVVVQGIAVALSGAAVGVAAALGVSRLLTKLLFDVKPDDPATLIVVVLLLVTVALVAAFLPARRATQVDPMIALRCE